MCRVDEIVGNIPIIRGDPNNHTNGVLVQGPTLEDPNKGSNVDTKQSSMKENKNINKMMETAPENPFKELYLKNFDIAEGRTLYLSRHGESEYNVEDRIGGNPPLTSRGRQYAHALGYYFSSADIADLNVWTSSLVRTHQTAANIPAAKISFKELDEIHAGTFDGMTYDEVAEMHPEEYKARGSDKLNYRYPKGESYIDCCKRLVPVLEKMENSPEHLLIVAHQAILRCIVTYLLKGDLRKLPNTKIPQHSLIRVTYLNGENIIDYIRTPVDHHEQGVVKSLLNDIEEPQSRIILKQVI